MASISTTSLYGSTTNSNAIGGLVSGLDTDELVESMTTETTTKISEAYQAQQTLVYEQEIYRSISSKMVDFNDKYFSYSTSSGYSILSSTFFEEYEIESSSDYVSVTGDEDNINNFSISNIASVASGASYISDIMVSDQTITSDVISDSDVLSVSDATEYITFSYNGVATTINLDSSITTVDGLKTYLQDELDEFYGENNVTVGLTADNCITFSSASNDNGDDTDDTDVLKVSGISSDLSTILGIDTTASNRLDKTSDISEVNFATDLTGGVTSDGVTSYEMKINGVSFTFEDTMSINDIVSEINSNTEAGVKAYYSSTTDTFTVKTTATGSNTDIEIEDVDGNLAEVMFGTSATVAANKEAGTDTIMTYTLNGKTNTITRSTQNITIDQISVTLNENAANTSADDYPITFTATNDTDAILEKMTEFISDYNEILSLINTEVTTQHDTDYDPLTPAQEDEMTESEIEDWEEEAKSGLLYGDSILRNIASDFREAMSSLTTASGLSLSSIGISAASYDTSGELEIDEDTFLESLAQNYDSVVALFSDTSTTGTSGIAVQLKSILKYNIGNYGRSGVLIDKAGLDTNSTDDDNYISDEIDEYDDIIEDLQDYLEDEQEKYWAEFSALETALNSLNTQSSMITSMLGS
jgi:flagellar hook-associated protein 2